MLYHTVMYIGHWLWHIPIIHRQAFSILCKHKRPFRPHYFHRIFTFYTHATHTHTLAVY